MAHVPVLVAVLLRAACVVRSEGHKKVKRAVERRESESALIRATTWTEWTWSWRTVALRRRGDGRRKNVVDSLRGRWAMEVTCLARSLNRRAIAALLAFMYFHTRATPDP